RNAVKQSIEKLSAILAQHPDWSEGFYLRSLFKRCLLQETDLNAVLKDLDAAISMHSRQRFPRLHKDGLKDFYSLRANTHFAAGRFRQAMDDLDKAINQDPASAAQFVNSGEIAPTTKSTPCVWSSSDLDTLVQKFSQDYRTYLYRGLYLTFFTTFNEE